MYKQLHSERAKFIRDAGRVRVNVPGLEIINVSSFTTRAKVEYHCSKNHSNDFIILKGDFISSEDLAIFQDISFHKDVANYPPSVLEELSKMALETLYSFSYLNGFRYLLVTSDIPFYPEIFSENGYSVVEYLLMKNDAWQGMKDVS
jgi:hypothetical protein